MHFILRHCCRRARGEMADAMRLRGDSKQRWTGWHAVFYCGVDTFDGWLVIVLQHTCACACTCGNATRPPHVIPPPDLDAREPPPHRHQGTRFDSSNYDPTEAFNCGSQIVALNWQTCDKPMWINAGRFAANVRPVVLLLLLLLLLLLWRCVLVIRPGTLPPGWFPP